MSYTGPERRIDHGTRARYQRGCRATCCRRANSAYSSALRHLKARGHRPFGSRVSAKATWKLIRKLIAEGFTKAEIARRLGLKRPALRFDTQAVQVQTEQRVLAFYEGIMAEGQELP